MTLPENSIICTYITSFDAQVQRRGVIIITTKYTAIIVLCASIMYWFGIYVYVCFSFYIIHVHSRPSRTK